MKEIEKDIVREKSVDRILGIVTRFGRKYRRSWGIITFGYVLGSDRRIRSCSYSVGTGSRGESMHGMQYGVLARKA